MSEAEKQESVNRKSGRSRFGKFVLLLWKNLILRKRHWVLTLFELGIPTALICLLLFLRTIPDSKLLPKEYDRISVFDPLTERGLRANLCDKTTGTWFLDMCIYNEDNSSYAADRRLLWGPPTPFTERMIEIIRKEIFFTESHLENVSSIDDMDDLVDVAYLEAANSVSSFFIGIFFYFDDSDTEIPVHLNYDLRLQKHWFTGYIYPSLQIPGPRNYTGSVTNFGASYNIDGFTILQTIIDRAYMKIISNNEHIVDDILLETEMYPYPPYIQDHGLSQFFGSLLPTFIVFSLVLLSPTLIKSIVYEKETGVRELIRMMGFEGWLIWLGWFMYSFTVIFIVCIIVTVLLKIEIMANDGSGIIIPPILIYSDGFFVFFFLILYGISAVCFCFAISCFFSKPTLATTIGVMLWLLSYIIPWTFIDDIYDQLSLGGKLAICLMPNLAMAFGFKIIGMFEGRALGVQWDNLWDTGNPRDQLAPAMILIMLATDTVIYILITWYVDQVLPGIYGVAKPWYFLFQKSYWRRSKSTFKEDDTVLDDDLGDQENPYTEPEPKGLAVGIKVRGLRKEFTTLKHKVKVAVENVDLTCYKGQCTVLLGHNGAGKTTTMSILTGVYSATGGYAEVNGWNIKTHLTEARKDVGLCPQHNTLFTDLSVEEHLLFFAMLKGLSRKDAMKEAKGLLHRLALYDKKNQYGGQLSGGMKRKLCLAIALIGGSKIIILDEPSSGLDPESRRWVWDVVQQERGSRTVLVTTHHMEEADVLGDRVAIMVNGRIFCCGSSLFLKNTFGRGYTLSIAGQEETELSKLQEVISGYIADSTLDKTNGFYFDFILPSHTERFPDLLDHLTREKEQLKINHIGLSLTTMEQVFLRVGEIMNVTTNESNPDPSIVAAVNEAFEPDDDNASNGASNNSSDRGTANLYIEQAQAPTGGNASYREHKLKGNKLRFQRFRSLWTKKFIYSKRKWVLLITQSLIPVLVSIMLLEVQSSFNQEDFKELPMELNINMFENTFSSVEEHDGLGDFTQNYMNLFYDPYKVNITDNITDTLLQAAYDNLNTYRENYVTSAMFKTENQYTVTRMFYQSIPYHTPGIGTNLIDNAVLHLKLGTNYSITTSNAPLPVNKAWQIDGTETSYSAALYATSMPFALSFLTASFVVFPLQERISNAKQIQIMTGTSTKMLWFVTYIWDLLSYTVSALLIFIFFMLLDTKAYFTVDGAPGALFLLLMFYGIGSIPMAYVFSFPFLSAASGFAFLAFINILAGMIISSVTIALNVIGSDNLVHISDIIGNITSFIPTYPASMGFLGIVDLTNYNRMCDIIQLSLRDELCDNLHSYVTNSSYLLCCEKYCEEFGSCHKQLSYLQWDPPGIGQPLMFLTVDFLFYFIILFMLEIGLWDIASIKLWKQIRKIFPIESTETVSEMDDDVAREQKVAHELMHDDNQEQIALVVKDLTKIFEKTGTMAVDKVSFHVKKGECFGLLGVNGAGKTTTFRMLTGDEVRTDGDARIGKNFLSHGRKQFMEEIGYCPQFDAIIGELTGEEMLSLMAGLRGVAKRRQPTLIQRLIDLVDLTECAKRPSSTYSGGNKRKLSTAMALIGQPPLVFLDEPTSGVDPASRRRVWEAVRDAARCGQSVILTSHSMDECEALCSNVVIMAKGVLKCAGTPKHLKAKFGKGYTLQVKLKSSLPHELIQSLSEEEIEEKYFIFVTRIKAAIVSSFPGSILTDEHRGMIVYKVPSTISWSDIFNKMEALKSVNVPLERRNDDISETIQQLSDSYNLLIEDYAATDPSLEQVFLSFARDEQKSKIQETKL